jgi:hypothetical protein
MGHRFSKMHDRDREALAAELFEILSKLGDLQSPDDFGQYGKRAAFIIAYLYSSIDEGDYNKDALFSDDPLIEGVGNVQPHICSQNNKRLVSLFGEEITEQIKRDVLRVWMEFLLNNIPTDEDATKERVEECRWMLSREIVRRVCEGAIADEQE